MQLWFPVSLHIQSCSRRRPAHALDQPSSGCAIYLPSVRGVLSFHSSWSFDWVHLTGSLGSFIASEEDEEDSGSEAEADPVTEALEALRRHLDNDR